MTINIINDNVANQIQTTQSESISALSYNILQNTTAKITLSVMCRDLDRGDSAGWEKKFIVKRGVGNAETVGEIIDSMPYQFDASLKYASVGVSTNGSSISIDINGIDQMTLDWDVQMSIRILNIN